MYNSEQTAALVARALLNSRAVGFLPASPVTFKSGLISPVYIDSRRLPFHPAQWQTVIQGFQNLIQAERLSFEVIAGVAVGGLPHSAALAYSLNIPSVFVRKEAKGHGTKKLIEGGDVAGKHVLLIEDMVTTGGSSLDAVNILRAEGAVIEHVVAIVSYGFSEAAEAFAANRVHLHSLTNFQAILDEAEDQFTSTDRAVIQDWLDDPYGWAQRHGFA